MSIEITTFSIPEAAEVLGIHVWQLRYLIKTGAIPKPRHSFKGRQLFFVLEDIEQTRQFLLLKRTQKN